MERFHARRAGIALVAISAAAASPATAQWNYARWGATADEVVAASGGAASTVADNEDQRVFGQLHLATAVGTQDGIDYEINFYFDPTTKLLSVVDLNPSHSDSDCGATLHNYSVRLGKSEDEHQNFDLDDGAKVTLSTYKWSDPASHDRVQFTEAIRDKPYLHYCKIIYQPPA